MTYRVRWDESTNKKLEFSIFPVGMYPAVIAGVTSLPHARSVIRAIEKQGEQC